MYAAASVSRRSYLVGILPTASIELPALVLCLRGRLYRGARVERAPVRWRQGGPHPADALRGLDVFLYVSPPCSRARGVIETYVTPRLLAMDL